MKNSSCAKVCIAFSFLIYLLTVSCAKSPAAPSSDKSDAESNKNVSQFSHYDDKAIADESNTSEWLAYGRTHSETRFSPLQDINMENVDQLKVDWFLDLPNDVGLVSTPLVVDGTLYFTGTMNLIRAVDAVTGELLWEYEPKVAEARSGESELPAGNTTAAFLSTKASCLPLPGTVALFALDAQSERKSCGWCEP